MTAQLMYAIHHPPRSSTTDEGADDNLTPTACQQRRALAATTFRRFRGQTFQFFSSTTCVRAPDSRGRRGKRLQIVAALGSSLVIPSFTFPGMLMAPFAVLLSTGRVGGWVVFLRRRSCFGGGTWGLVFMFGWGWGEGGREGFLFVCSGCVCVMCEMREFSRRFG